MLHWSIKQKTGDTRATLSLLIFLFDFASGRKTDEADEKKKQLDEQCRTG